MTSSQYQLYTLTVLILEIKMYSCEIQQYIMIIINNNKILNNIT